MGCGGSKSFSPNPKVKGQGQEVMRAMSELHYSQDDVDDLLSSLGF